MVAFQHPVSASLAVLLQAACTMAAVAHRDSAAYLDTSLSPTDRAADLVQHMTWEEKVSHLGGVRRGFGTSDGRPTFNRTTYETVRSTQNGQIGE